MHMDQGPSGAHALICHWMTATLCVGAMLGWVLRDWIGRSICLYFKRLDRPSVT